MWSMSWFAGQPSKISLTALRSTQAGHASPLRARRWASLERLRVRILSGWASAQALEVAALRPGLASFQALMVASWRSLFASRRALLVAALRSLLASSQALLVASLRSLLAARQALP